MSHPVESLEYINCPGSSSPRPIKIVLILSETTVRRSGVDREHLKPYTANRKEFIFLKVINRLIIYKFSKDFTNHRNKTNSTLVFSCRALPKYLNTDENFQQSGKTRFLQTHIGEFSLYI